MYVGTCNFCNITGNEIAGSGRYGIKIKGSKDNTICDNIFYNNSQTTDNAYSDIELWAEGEITSERNLISDNVITADETNKSKSGVDIGSQPDNVIVSNIISGPYIPTSIPVGTVSSSSTV